MVGSNALTTLHVHVLDTIRATIRKEIQKQFLAAATISEPSAPGIQEAPECSEVAEKEPSGPIGTVDECGSGIHNQHVDLALRFALKEGKE